MNEQYWGLFWSTGMPEAWLMSRNGERAGTEAEPGPAPGAKPAPEGKSSGPPGPV